MRSFKTVLIPAIFLAALVACANELTKIKINVLDEKGIPIPDVTVNLSFVSADKIRTLVDKTDKSGGYSAESVSTMQTGYVLSKHGFYDSRGEFGIGSHDETLLLRKVKNPIALERKNANTRVEQAHGNWVGFDLLESDFVAPLGSGKVIDFEFKIDKQFVDSSNNSFSMEVEFGNEGDGMILYRPTPDRITSEFIYDYEAPLEGYLSKWSFVSGYENGKSTETNMSRQNKYYFRIRSEFDEAGNLVGAYYGVIENEFAHSPGFTYFVNTQLNSRNIEFLQ